MKLATLKDGSRDGQLVVVSRDLMSAHYATGIADRLQQALDDWNFISPQLQDLYDTLNHGKARHAFVFEARQCMAPLPRAYLLAVGDAYALANATPKPIHLIFSDQLLGPCAPLALADPERALDFAAALAVITADIPKGARSGQALDGVRLLTLVNHVQLHTDHDASASLSPYSLFSAFSPVAVTPDELVWNGVSAWHQGCPNLSLKCSVNGHMVGSGNLGMGMGMGMGMANHFGGLLVQLCQSRRLAPGSILSSGEVRFADAASGFCSITAQRASEASQTDAALTPWLTAGDTLQLDVTGPDGQSVFGAISQAVSANA
jgi:fumarylacetoacetate (FAA) hydrolase